MAVAVNEFKRVSNIPILFATKQEAEEYLKDPENVKLAEKAVTHYAQALTVQSRAITVENNPTEKDYEEARKRQEAANLKAPDSPVEVKLQKGKE